MTATPAVLSLATSPALPTPYVITREAGLRTRRPKHFLPL